MESELKCKNLASDEVCHTPEEQILSPMQGAILRRIRSALESVHGFHEACCRALQKQDKVSLRMLDWFVTNYAKRRGLRIASPMGGHVVVHDAYRAALSAFRRRNFDPFCRVTKRTADGSKVHNTVWLYDNQRKAIRTSVSQLNFMLWAYQNGVLQFAVAHTTVIEDDMNQAAAAARARRRNGVPQRRAQLSRPPLSMCHTYAGVRTVDIA